MITLHYYNTVSLKDEVVELTDSILIHARQGEFVNLSNYCKDYTGIELRKVLDIKYVGEQKQIHLSGHRY